MTYGVREDTKGGNGEDVEWAEIEDNKFKIDSVTELAPGTVHKLEIYASSSGYPDSEHTFPIEVTV